MANNDASSYNIRFNEIAQVIEYSNGLNWLSVPSSGVTPGGANTQVQFNDSGAFGGNAHLIYNKSTQTLTVGEGGVNFEAAGVTKGNVSCGSGGSFGMATEDAIPLQLLGNLSVLQLDAVTGGLGYNDNNSIITLDPSAVVDIQSITKGFLFPRLTTTQKNAIASPAEGLTVYDTTLHKLCVWTGAAWETITSA